MNYTVEEVDDIHRRAYDAGFASGYGIATWELRDVLFDGVYLLSKVFVDMKGTGRNKRILKILENAFLEKKEAS